MILPRAPHRNWRTTRDPIFYFRLSLFLPSSPPRQQFWDFLAHTMATQKKKRLLINRKGTRGLMPADEPTPLAGRTTPSPSSRQADRLVSLKTTSTSAARSRPVLGNDFTPCLEIRASSNAWQRRTRTYFSSVQITLAAPIHGNRAAHSSTPSSQDLIFALLKREQTTASTTGAMHAPHVSFRPHERKNAAPTTKHRSRYIEALLGQGGKRDKNCTTPIPPFVVVGVTAHTARRWREPQKRDLFPCTQHFRADIIHTIEACFSTIP